MDIQGKKTAYGKVEKQGFRIDRKRPTAIASTLAFALCVPMQILGYADRLEEPIVAAALVFLPVLSALLMILAIQRFGRTALWFSIFGVTVGVLGFVFKLMIDPRETGLLHHTAAIVLYVAIVALWTLTVLYVIRTKWVLVILFLVPFCKHIFMNDLPVLLGTASSAPLSTWLKEGSMLCFLLALSCFALSLEKARAAEP